MEIATVLYLKDACLAPISKSWTILILNRKLTIDNDSRRTTVSLFSMSIVTTESRWLYGQNILLSRLEHLHDALCKWRNIHLNASAFHTYPFFHTFCNLYWHFSRVYGWIWKENTINKKISIVIKDCSLYVVVCEIIFCGLCLVQYY